MRLPFLRIFLVLFVALIVSCQKHTFETRPAKPVPEPSCDSRLAFTESANAFHRLGNLRELCGHLERPYDFLACANLPPPLSDPFNPFDNCEGLREQTQKTDLWLDRMDQALFRACSHEPACAEILSSWD